VVKTPQGSAVAVDEVEIERRISFADAALGAAGHEVTDPYLRALQRRVILGELTAEAAIAAGIAHIDAR
jgi:hypothetical protein